MDTGSDIHAYLHYITNKTSAHNRDNITRTNAYFTFYLKFPEIKWAFLASMVSRNAGWNMTDLCMTPFRYLLGKRERERLFMTYERANWLIFSDAFPQLLVYQLSKQKNKPMFDLLSMFHVSSYMIKEWHYFWKYCDKNRLVHALIINEQNVIQGPVIEQDFFQRRVFHQLPYQMQNILMTNAVLFPTMSTNLYGTYVQYFTNLTKRIFLGKKLASIMFSPSVYEQTFLFAKYCTHTGSRRDYERFLKLPAQPSTPRLRTVYPVITHHDTIRSDWYQVGGIKRKWLRKMTANKNQKIGKTFYQKRQLLFAYFYAKQALITKKYFIGH
ncbi:MULTISPECIES: DUF2515 family protein [Clostridia]|uniref:DUF2515 family protein n=1 Tax=Clostridia TaxID=186801 RepID=UPI000EA112F1|nr:MULTISPECIES: DUF2515 family protein [Clostridia]NBJ71473.1 DUF2515 domain-containing protein [Roseburia sp. 1XD42-34]RKI74493.1 DUF2515 domain-containing protein [Clostridium sp. 1xD42-85]